MRVIGSRGRNVGMLLALALAAWAALVAPAAQAALKPSEDPFYRYEGNAPLAGIAPGTVLKTRTLAYHVAGVPLPVSAVQLLYRSTGPVGQPTVNVTSVLLPPLRLGRPRSSPTSPSTTRSATKTSRRTRSPAA
jgi:hypothetical protein